MSSIERACVAYFTDAIESEKQSELSPVSISELNIYLTSATAGIRRHIKSAYNGDLAEFLRRYPENFQLDGSERVFRTSDIVQMHGTDNLEKMSVQFFKEKLRSMKAFHHSAVPVMGLRKFLGEASSGVQSLFNLNYPGREMKRFFQNHPEEFGVSLSGNVYLVSEPPAALLNECDFGSFWHSDNGMLDSEVSKDEADAVEFYRQVLNSPGIELQTCSIDSLFAQLCEAPSNVQRFLKKTYNEVNFLDFFNAHKSSFCVTTNNGQTTSHQGNRSPGQSSRDNEFPALPLARSHQGELHCETPWETRSSADGSMADRLAAIQFFEDIVKDHMQRGVVAHVDQLRKCLADAPLLVFAYFQHFYPYRQFDRFFLDHATHFSIDSSGAVELSFGERNKTAPAANSDKAPTEDISPGSGDSEENGEAWRTRSLPLEKQLEKFFLDLLNLAGSYGVRVVKPDTLLSISTCLHRRLSAYLLEHYGKSIASFFQHYQNHFRVSKNGNVCLAAEVESGSETMAKKQPSVLALEVFAALMQLLQSHQIKAVSPEILWEFLPLTPPKVQGFLCKAYNKETLKNFLLKPPSKFALSKNKNIYLSMGPGSLRRDLSDEEEQDYHQASENLCEASALEFFVDLIKTLRLSTYPIPVAVLQENLSKASPFVKNYFEEIYPQDKFLDFFDKYRDFFFVLRTVAVVWLAQSDGEEEEDGTEPKECPFSSKPKSFCQVIGIVAADLLVKSPKPFSTVLGHLNVIKEQSTQELNKHQGKSKTEKLCSLVSSCFDMFKIAKDNVILSWPLKHQASLLFVLEEALAAVCTKLATGNMVDIATFYTMMRHKIERMFQCLVPDTAAMLLFFHKRDEFLVLNEEHLIVLSSGALPTDQVEEIALLVEVELNKTDSGNAPLVSVLSALLDESFEHSFTSSTVVQAILNQKNRFRLQDGQLYFLGKKACDGQTNCKTGVQVPTQDSISFEQFNGPPVQGRGWIISLGKENGVLAATFGGSSDYAEVSFHTKTLSPASTSFTQLCIGQEVEFLAVRETECSEWNIMELIGASSMPYIPEEKVSNEQSDDEDHSNHVRTRHTDAFGPPSEDDDDSTNGDDRIFYSSASDSEPTVTTRSDVAQDLPPDTQPGPTLADDSTTASDCPQGNTIEQTALAKLKNCALDTPLEIAEKVPDDEEDEWETPYDRRIVSLSKFTNAGVLNMWTKADAGSGTTAVMPLGVPPLPHDSKPDAIPGEGHDHVQKFLDSLAEEPQDLEASAEVSHQTDLTEQAGIWDGSAIWDIDPVSETVESMRSDCLEQAEQTPSCEKDVDVKATKDWDPEMLTVSVSEVNESTTTEDFVSVTESIVSEEPGGMLCDEGHLNDRSSSTASPTSRTPTVTDEPTTLTSTPCQPRREDSITFAEDTYTKVHVTADNGALEERAQSQELMKSASGAETTDYSHVTVESIPESRESSEVAAVTDVGDVKDMDIAAGGDGHGSFTMSECLRVTDVLPFGMLLDEQEVVHSVPATVVYVCPSVAVLVSRVHGSPVKLVLAPDESTSLQWPLLCVGQRVAVRAVGDLSGSCILRVVRLRPLRSRPEVRAPGMDASAQTVSTGPIMSGLLLVD
ncbi:uncharacterized protein LOC115319909 [Ixodes scapularis]|uniref:uncharacterized protein LOC115319909 n=1 Tax=Ixodes scapularis TaxID=6945 RepID=UPI001C3954D8|nr:uncharacterized protein LOC115319909 [Ixodes scapularis]